jgi:hypothetical protein
MSYDPTREWNITSVDITLANDNGHFLYVKVPIEADVTTSEVIASEAHIDPLRDEGYIIYKLGWITPVVDGKRTAQMLWGNNKPVPVDKVVEDISFEFADVVAGTAKDYTLDIKASFPYDILSACLETDDGTLTGVAVKIGSTAVTSLSSVTVDTAVDETSATGANSVATGDRVSLSVSTGYSGAPTLIRGKLKIKRT